MRHVQVDAIGARTPCPALNPLQQRAAKTLSLAGGVDCDVDDPPR